MSRQFMNGNYIEFLDNNGREMLGSDGVCSTDGRLGVEKLKEFGRKILKSRKNVKPHMMGMNIWKNGRCIYSNTHEII